MATELNTRLDIPAQDATPPDGLRTMPRWARALPIVILLAFGLICSFGAWIRSAKDPLLFGGINHLFSLLASGVMAFLFGRSYQRRAETRALATKAKAAYLDLAEAQAAELREKSCELDEAQRIGAVGSWRWLAGTGQIEASDEARRIFGFATGPGRALDCRDLNGALFSHRQRRAVWAALRQAWRTGPAGQFEVEAFCRGRPIWVLVGVEPLLGGDAKRIGLWGTVQDISTRKRDAEAIAELQGNLQHLHAQQVGIQTAAAIAHELNQPLMAINAHAEVGQLLCARLPAPYPALDRTLLNITEGVARASALVRNLVNFCQSPQAERQPVKLRSLVREALALIDMQIPHGKAIPVSGLAAEIVVRADRLQLEKVLLNLLGNSIEATEGLAKGHVAIEIAVADQMAVLSVVDTGPGVPVGLEDKVFEPFFTTKPNGLGMGLAISRALIQANGGDIRWARRPAGGAVFSLTLPLAEAMEEK
jgi:signal transduction histidine kinase